MTESMTHLLPLHWFAHTVSKRYVRNQAPCFKANLETSMTRSFDRT